MRRASSSLGQAFDADTRKNVAKSSHQNKAQWNLFPFMKNIFSRRMKGMPNIAQNDADTPLHRQFSLQDAIAFIGILPVAMCISDSSGHILFRNEEFVSVIKAPAAEPFHILTAILPQDADKFYSSITRMSNPLIAVKRIGGEFATKTNGSTRSRTLHWTIDGSILEGDYLLFTAKYIATSRDNLLPQISSLMLPLASKYIERGFQKTLKESQGNGEIVEINDSTDRFIQECNSLANGDMKLNDEDEGMKLKWKTFCKSVEKTTQRALKLKEEQMKSQQLLEILETKRIFVRHVSHEIRTPLNVVMSGLEYLETFRTQMSDDIIELLHDIRSACSIAIDILNDLLTYEKLDSNVLILDKCIFNAIELIHKAISMFMIQAKHSNIHLVIESNIQDLIMIEADSTKISQVIRNLLSNALKFTPVDGCVTVKLHVNGTENMLIMQVHDTGPGMKIEDRKKLFNEIVQFNPKELQNGQGSGLGLYLSRKIVDMHDGHIGVDLEWTGKGSIFFISLPIQAIVPKAIPTPISRSLAIQSLDVSSIRVPSKEAASSILRQPSTGIDAIFGRTLNIRLLVVDDAVLVRKLHRRILTPLVSEIIEAVDGIDALEKFQIALDENRPFDGILMDSSMPNMDGTLVAKAIRGLGYEGKIFGITGNAMQIDIDNFIAHGATEVFVKPVGLDKYKYMLDQISQEMMLRRCVGVDSPYNDHY